MTDSLGDRSARPLVLGVFWLVVLSAWAVGQQEVTDPVAERLRAVRAMYKANSWPKGALRAGLPVGSLEIDGWKGGALRSDAGHVTRRFTADKHRKANGRAKAPAFLVESLVANTVELAHAQLVTWLASIQSPVPASRSRDRAVDVGEVGFVGTSGAGINTIAWIAFVRGNVAVRLSNCDPRTHPDLEMGSVARAIDKEIAAPLAPGTKIPLPTISRLACEKKRAVAGDVLPIEVEVVDPMGGTPHLQWVVGGPGQGYVEQDADGVWQLHTTGPGVITLSLEVTGSTGTFVVSKTELSVSDDF